MKKIIGQLGDRLAVRDAETGEFDSTLETFVDDNGHMLALAKDDPRHPGETPVVPPKPKGSKTSGTHNDPGGT